MATMESRTGRQSRYEDQSHAEGYVARTIEQQTAKLPSDVFMWAAFGSMAASVFLHYAERNEESLFVGQWAPTLLIFGLYNKLVKVAGSDRATE